MDLTTELKRSSCFAPRILRRQVLDIITNQLIHEDVPSASADAGPFALALQGISSQLLAPSIRHFHGALLFVDISGFTRLSQKMDVDNLRKFINAYFTKLIDIVSKYEGEVIKFAGDAMYIIWQSKLYGQTTDKEEQIQIAVKKASICAAEIIQVCSNYKVELQGDPAASSAINLNLTLPSKLNRTTSRKASFLIAEDALQQQADLLNSLSAAGDDILYLNVHCGLSVGMMSGIDIGSDGRWEYFIVGPPLKEVAEAEECASSGEVLMTDAAHRLIHPHSHGDTVIESSDGGEKHSTCHCQQHPRGFWNLEQSGVCGFSFLGRCPSNDSGVLIPDDDENRHNLDLADDLATACREYYKLFDKEHQGKTDKKPMGVSKLASILQRCLLDHLVLHTHQAVRNIIQVEMTTVGLESHSDSVPNSARLDSPCLSPMQTTRRGERQKSTTFVNRMRELTRSETKHDHSPSKEKGIDIADQREAITCFVNIQYYDHGKDIIQQLHNFLSVDALQLGVSPYNFVVVRGDSEQNIIEQQAIQVFQSSLEVVIESFHRAGGQIRQFIVDDKGTVAIGTFGLRGSVSRDNTSSAVDTALRIMSELKSRVGAGASIGITSGKVYNGLVGSGYRHEFAVMGPTVNMSARLMGKAPVDKVLCDQAVKGSDHVHQFVHFADVDAKGYDMPVPVYFPISTTASMAALQPQIIEQIARQVDTDHNLKIDVMSTGGGATGSGDFDHYLVGRKAYMPRINEFLQDLACKKDIWQQILVNEQHLHNPSLLRAHSHVHHHPHAAALALLSENGSPSGIAAPPPDSPKADIFVKDAETRVIILEGIHGSGKSHLLHEVCVRVAKYLDETSFEANVAVHVIPQSRLKHSEPFSGIRPLLDTIMNRYSDWTAKRSFDPVQPVEMSRRTKTKALRSLSALLEKLPADMQVYIPLFSIVSKHFVVDDNDVTRTLSAIEKLRHLGNFLFVLLQTFQREIGRLLFLNIDELELMDRNSQELFKLLIHQGKGFVIMMVASAESPLALSDFSTPIQSIETRLECRPSLLLKIRIEPLSRDDVEDMTLKFLATSCLEVEISEDDLQVAVDHIFAFSSGNTLYVIEMLKSLRTQLLNPVDDEAKTVGSDESSTGHTTAHTTASSKHTSGINTPMSIGTLTNTSVANTPSSRKLKPAVSPMRKGSVIITSGGNAATGGVITPLLLENKKTIRQHLKKVEEVVAIRFGSLSDPCQLLLKVMSVACAFGADTTPSMLATMVHAFSDKAFLIFGCDNEVVLASKIYEILERLLKSSEFLVRRDDEDDGNGSLMLEGGHSPSKFYVKSKSRTLSMSVESVDSSTVLPDGDSFSSKDPSMTMQMYRQSTSTVASTLSALSTSLVADHRRHSHKYNFRLDLEQQVIFGMLLTEQRALLHQTAAEVYKNTHALMLDIPVTEMYDQALHWRACEQHPQALSCFYHAGAALVQQGAVEEGQEHLSLAYDMFVAMKTSRQQKKQTTSSNHSSKGSSSGGGGSSSSSSGGGGSSSKTSGSGGGGGSGSSGSDNDASTTPLNRSPSVKMRTPMNGPTVLESDEHLSYEFKDLVAYLSRIYLPSSSSTSNATIASSTRGYTSDDEEQLADVLHAHRLKRSDVAAMFHGDSALLEECIEAITHLVYYKGLYGSLAPVVYLKLCEEVLELVVASLKKRRPRGYSKVDTNESSSTGEPPSVRRQAQPAPSESFALQDMSVCLPIIFHIYMATFNVGAKVAFVDARQFPIDRLAACQLFVAIARDAVERGQSGLADNRYHLAVALGNLRGVYLEMGRLDDAWSVMDEQAALYDYATMHERITERYGHDQCPVNIVSSWKLAFLVGDVTRTENAWRKISTFVVDTMEFRALEIAMMNIVHGLLIMERIEEAYFCCRRLIAVMSERFVGTAQQNPSFLRVGIEFLYILLRLMIRNKYIGIHLYEAGGSSHALSELLAHMLTGTFLFDHKAALLKENPHQSPQATVMDILAEVVYGRATEDVVVANRLFERLSAAYNEDVVRDQQDGPCAGNILPTLPSYIAYANRIGFTDDGLYALFCQAQAEYLMKRISQDESQVQYDRDIDRGLVSESLQASATSLLSAFNLARQDSRDENTSSPLRQHRASSPAMSIDLGNNNRILIRDYLQMGLFYSQRGLARQERVCSASKNGQFTLFNGCFYLIHRIHSQLRLLEQQLRMPMLPSASLSQRLAGPGPAIDRTPSEESKRDDTTNIRVFLRQMIDQYHFRGIALQVQQYPWAKELFYYQQLAPTTGAASLASSPSSPSYLHVPLDMIPIDTQAMREVLAQQYRSRHGDHADQMARQALHDLASPTAQLAGGAPPPSSSSLPSAHHHGHGHSHGHGHGHSSSNSHVHHAQHHHHHWHQLDRAGSRQSIDTAPSCMHEAATIVTGTGTTMSVHDDDLDPVESLVEVFYPFAIPYYVLVARTAVTTATATAAATAREALEASS